jgi:hypothetical protein
VVGHRGNVAWQGTDNGYSPQRLRDIRELQRN